MGVWAFEGHGLGSGGVVWLGGPVSLLWWSLFFFNDTATTEIYTLSLHDALPIPSFVVLCCPAAAQRCLKVLKIQQRGYPRKIFRSAQNLYLSRNHLICWQISCSRSEEHTSELQSHSDLVCRLLLEKKNAFTHLKLPFRPM